MDTSKGILPPAAWLKKYRPEGYRAMLKRPELFAHIPQEVSERALVGRINRKLENGERLRVARNYPGGYENSNLGRYYILDAQNNLVATHCDIEKLGRELGVLAERERMAF